MTKNENTGAAKYRDKQRTDRIIHNVALIPFLVVSGVLGYPVGVAAALEEPVQSIVSAPVAWALVSAMFVGFWVYVYIVAKSVDEVEIQHNYWAGGVTLNFFMSVFITCEALYWMDAAPAVDARILFGATFAVMMLAYFGRRYWAI